jgi:hypothetical protein
MAVFAVTADDGSAGWGRCRDLGDERSIPTDERL